MNHGASERDFFGAVREEEPRVTETTMPPASTNVTSSARAGQRATRCRETALTRARYDRIARLYDRLETGRMWQWRAMLWERVRGPRVLELGVGTGKSFPLYRAGWRVTGVDLSPRMLDQATRHARRDGVNVALLLGDAQALPFPDACFDTVAASLVFCSVPDPVLGLREAYRVLVPGGQLLLLEHMVSQHPLLRPLMRAVNPVVVRVMGANIDRETVGNVERAGFAIRRVDDLWGDIVKLVEAARW